MNRKSLLRTGLAVVACTGVAAPSVLAAGLRQPAAQHTTPQGLRADGLRLQGIAHAYQLSRRSADALEPLSSKAPTAQGLKAYGLRLQGIAHAYS